MSEPLIVERFLSAGFFELLYKVRRRYAMFGSDALSTLKYIQSAANAQIFSNWLERICHVCELKTTSIEVLSRHMDNAHQHPLSQISSLMDKVDQIFVIKRECLLYCDVSFEQAQYQYLNKAKRLNPFQYNQIMQSAARLEIVSLEVFGCFICEYDQSGKKFLDQGVSDAAHGFDLASEWYAIEKDQWKLPVKA
jgi:hypothetical protein